MNFIDWYLESLYTNKIKNVFLYGEGGMGKSSILRYIAHKLIEDYNNENRFIPIFVDAKMVVSCENGIEEYVSKEYSSNSKCKLYDVFSNNKNYKFVIIIDSINEISAGVLREKIVYFLQDKTDLSNVFLLISSRLPLSHYDDLSELNFKAVHLKRYKPEFVLSQISNDYNVENTKRLTQVLYSPMMLTIFSKTEDKTNILESPSSGMVLREFFKQQKALTSNWRTEITNIEKKRLIGFALDVVMPCLCQYGDLLFGIDIVKNIIQNSRNFDVFDKIILKNKYDEIKWNDNYYILIQEYLRDDIQILSQDHEITIHQIYASYFQAEYLKIAVNHWLAASDRKPLFVFFEDYYEGQFNSKTELALLGKLNLFIMALHTSVQQNLMLAQVAIISKHFIELFPSNKYFNDYLKALERASEGYKDTNKGIIQKLLKNVAKTIIRCAQEEVITNNNNLSETKVDELKEKIDKSIYKHVISLVTKWVSRYTYPKLAEGDLSFSFISGNSKEIFCSVAEAEIQQLLEHLRQYRNSTYYNYVVRFLFFVLQYKKISDLSGFDFSGIDLSGAYIKNNSYSYGSVHSNFIGTKMNSNAVLPSVRLIAVPLVNNDSVTLLWYTQEFFSVYYKEQNLVLFCFHEITLMNNRSILFNVASDKFDFCDPNFLFFQHETKDICVYNFLIDRCTTLFTLDKDIELSGVQALNWQKDCEKIVVTYNNSKYVYNLDGKLLSNSVDDITGPEIKSEKIMSSRFHTNASIIQNSQKVYLAGTNKLQRQFIYGKLGNDNFKIKQFRYNEEGTRVIAVCQDNSSYCVKEWATTGELVDTYYPFYTLIKHRFDCGFGGFEGYDGFFYYFDNGIFKKVELPKYRLLGPSAEGNHLYFTDDSAFIYIYSIKDESLVYEKKFNIRQEIDNENFETIYFQGNVVVKSFYSEIIEWYWLVDNMFVLSQKSDNYNTAYCFPDAITNKLCYIRNYVFGLLELQFKQYDFVDFYDVKEYNFYRVPNSESNKFLISVPKINACVIFNQEQNAIEAVFLNTTVFSYPAKDHFIINRSGYKDGILEYFPDYNFTEQNDYPVYAINVENCIFDFDSIEDEITKNILKRCGAKDNIKEQKQ